MSVKLPGLDALLDSVREGRAPDLTPFIAHSKALKDTQAAEVEELCAAAARVASTDDGRRVLTWLLEVTLQRPIYDAPLSMDTAAIVAAFRDGENAIARALFEIIRRGQGLDPGAAPNLNKDKTNDGKDGTEAGGSTLQRSGNITSSRGHRSKRARGS